MPLFQISQLPRVEVHGKNTRNDLVDLVRILKDAAIICGGWKVWQEAAKSAAESVTAGIRPGYPTIVT
jgi:hypothetical protein